MTAYCLVVEVPPTARDARCSQCRPSRRHSQRQPDTNAGLQRLMREHRR
jgi:hypothetical protein